MQTRTQSFARKRLTHSLPYSRAVCSVVFSFGLLFGNCFPLLAQRVDWTRQFGSNFSPYDVASAIVSDNTGIYVAGSTLFGLPGQTGPSGGLDSFIRKYDSSGNVLWTRQFGMAGDDSPVSIAAHDGTVYVVGAISTQTGVLGLDSYLRAYDSDGNILWTRQFGSASRDAAIGVSTDDRGAYVLSSENTFPGPGSTILRMFDFDGGERWNVEVRSNDRLTPVGVSSDPTGIYVAGYVFAGFVNTPGVISSNDDIFLSKYDKDGNQLWTRQAGTPVSDIVTGLALGDGGIYLSGLTRGAFPGETQAGVRDVFLCRYDVDGNQQWLREFGTSAAEDSSRVAVDRTGVSVAGVTKGTFSGYSNSGFYDYFVRNFSSDGIPMWTFQVGTNLQDIVSSIYTSSSGIYVAGYTSPLTEELISAAGAVAFLSKIAPPPPLVTQGAVVNAASYLPQGVVPGSLASAFGVELASANPGGTEVRLNGILAPIFATTATQVNFQVPWELAGIPTATLTVVVNEAASQPIEVPLATTAPGLFSTNAAGTGQGAILLANTGAIAARIGFLPGSQPATRGSFISIYCTGLGPVRNQPPTGSPAFANPPSTGIAIPTVTIGSKSATVVFSGLAPGFVGLYQIDVQVPFDAPVGDSIPVTLSIGTATSNTVSVAVQ